MFWFHVEDIGIQILIWVVVIETIALLWILIALLRAIRAKENPAPAQPSPVAKVVLLIDGTKEATMVADNGTATVTITPEDALGNAVAGTSPDASPAPAYSLSDPTMGSLAPSADNLSCVFTPSGKLGPFTVSFSGAFGGVAVTASASDSVVAGPITQIAMSITP